MSALPRRRRKGQPHDPAKVYDRRATDLLRNAMVAPMEVDDPIERGATLIVMRSVRSDPLAGLHARKQIGEAQYRGGRAFQRDFETIERGAQAIDPSKPYVDCSRGPEGISDAYAKALVRLNQIQRALGIVGSALAHAVLIDGRTIDGFCADRGMSSQREKEYYGRRFRDCLDELAQFYGLAMVTKD